jgi:hypothetical protein
MKSIFLAAASLSVIATSALADETVKYRIVQHATSFQSQQVSDVNGHSLGLYRLAGIAFFPDGSTGTTLVVGTNPLMVPDRLMGTASLLSAMAQRYGLSTAEQ